MARTQSASPSTRFRAARIGREQDGARRVVRVQAVHLAPARKQQRRAIQVPRRPIGNVGPDGAHPRNAVEARAQLARERAREAAGTGAPRSAIPWPPRLRARAAAARTSRTPSSGRRSDRARGPRPGPARRTRAERPGREIGGFARGRRRLRSGARPRPGAGARARGIAIAQVSPGAGGPSSRAPRRKAPIPRGGRRRSRRRPSANATPWRRDDGAGTRGSRASASP